MALARALEAELAALPEGLPPADLAGASVRALGTGYLRFARLETGLLRTAFASPVDASSSTPGAPGAPNAPDADKAGQSGLNPFQLLGTALDRLVDAGVLPPDRRPGAEYLLIRPAEVLISRSG